MNREYRVNMFAAISGPIFVFIFGTAFAVVGTFMILQLQGNSNVGLFPIFLFFAMATVGLGLMAYAIKLWFEVKVYDAVVIVGHFLELRRNRLLIVSLPINRTTIHLRERSRIRSNFLVTAQTRTYTIVTTQLRDGRDFADRLSQELNLPAI